MGMVFFFLQKIKNLNSIKRLKNTKASTQRNSASGLGLLAVDNGLVKHVIRDQCLRTCQRVHKPGHVKQTSWTDDAYVKFNEHV